MLSDSPALVLCGSSPAAERLREQVASAAASDANVLVRGEPGVGKVTIARSIHDQSVRRLRRFAVVPCDLLPERVLLSELFGHEEGSFEGAYRTKIGLVRQSDLGTLALQGLAKLGREAQFALFRFADIGEVRPIGAGLLSGVLSTLTSGWPAGRSKTGTTAENPPERSNVRLMAIANDDLARALEAGDFPEDLFHRLAALEITIPSVRERPEDIPVLFEQCLDHASRVHGLPAPSLSDAAAECAKQYRWPENMREMRRVAERLVTRSLGRPLSEVDVRAELNARRDVSGRAATVL
jgi:DNA-binding NtrC family response regulator